MNYYNATDSINYHIRKSRSSFFKRQIYGHILDEEALSRDFIIVDRYCDFAFTKQVFLNYRSYEPLVDVSDDEKHFSFIREIFEFKKKKLLKIGICIGIEQFPKCLRFLPIITFQMKTQTIITH